MRVIPWLTRRKRKQPRLLVRSRADQRRSPKKRRHRPAKSDPSHKYFGGWDG